MLDQLQIHFAPSLLGDGIRLFDHLDTEPVKLERIEGVDSPAVTHLRYRVVK